jgi:hypothetical protein
LIAHVLGASHRFGEVFGAAFLIAAVHAPGERDHAVVHAHLYVARVNIPILCQTVVYVFADALVGTLVTPRAAPRMRSLPHLVHTPSPLSLIVPEPGPDLIARALKEATFLAAAPALAAVVRLTVSTLMFAPVIWLAQAVTVFRSAVIVITIRLVVIPAGPPAPVWFAGITTAAIAVTRLLAAIAPFAPPLRGFFIAAALATVIRFVVIIPAKATAPVIIVMFVCHLDLLEKFKFKIDVR